MKSVLDITDVYEIRESIRSKIECASLCQKDKLCSAAVYTVRRRCALSRSHISTEAANLTLPEIYAYNNEMITFKSFQPAVSI